MAAGVGAGVLALAAGLLTAPAVASARPAEVWTGTVTHVTDGDTLWVRPARDGAPVKIRLHGVDAPERCQAGGPEATRWLQTHAQGRKVQVRSRARDDWGRVVAVVRLAPGREDLGAALVGAGWAWDAGWGRRPGPYQQAEAEARRARRGLHAGASPQRPRDFRRQHGSCPR
ncbi:thermonuclease family protein [Ideonella livida]|uniref:Thermonuclease family protein n=1 Tax=Ideonella livida TaxID=2707176 RepID=A0A7C9PF27_9BURK|nr:thermonuclease family protein [Ideonella livida]NDY89830.1 thermonuclease family protein [Ideonella livida]